MGIWEYAGWLVGWLLAVAAEAKKGGGESCSPSTHPPSSQLGNGTGGREERRRDVRLLLRSTAVVKRLVHGEAQRRKRTSFLQYIHTLRKNHPHSCFFQSVFSIGTHYSRRRMLTFALPYLSFLSSSAKKKLIWRPLCRGRNWVASA